MPVLSEFLLALVGSDFFQLTLSSAGHFKLSLYLIGRESSMGQPWKKVK
jgi:hypothetical protein